MEIISNKELVLNKCGATRERGAKVIADAMSANKMTVDKCGEEHSEPDHTIRLRAEELRARYTGDIKPDGATITVTHQITCSPQEAAHLIELSKIRNAKLEQLQTSGRQTGQIIDITPT